mmetsp:Transcript_9831/g.31084  ORF Transcript_9831/g.31084 Transcript_9831/m.31084 type:complete len:244 (+) Transcript_9831:102-833(+)
MPTRRAAAGERAARKRCATIWCEHWPYRQVNARSTHSPRRSANATPPVAVSYGTCATERSKLPSAASAPSASSSGRTNGEAAQTGSTASSPTQKTISWHTSVSATARKPPKSVYESATATEPNAHSARRPPTITAAVDASEERIEPAQKTMLSSTGSAYSAPSRSPATSCSGSITVTHPRRRRRGATARPESASDAGHANVPTDHTRPSVTIVSAIPFTMPADVYVAASEHAATVTESPCSVR